MGVIDVPQVANFSGTSDFAVSNVRYCPKYIRNVRYHALRWW